MYNIIATRSTRGIDHYIAKKSKPYILLYLTCKETHYVPDEVKMSECARKTLLLVEDEAILAMTEKMELEKHGYAVKVVNTGEKAVEAVKIMPEIDLVLMDINLGDGIDGTQSAEIILRNHDIPIVFVSSHSEREVVEKTEKITSYGYVVKSSSITVFDASIKMAFKLFKANQNVKNSDVYQKTLISNISDVIGIIGVDGIMKYKSPNIEKWFGWKPEDLIGTDGWESVHPDDLDRIKKEFNKLLEKDNSSTTVQYLYKCKDGSYKPIELTATNLMNNPAITGILLNYHDITERKRIEKRLKESEEKYRIAFMTSPDSVNINRMDGLYVDINQGFTSLTGYTHQDVIGKLSSEIRIWSIPEDREKLVKGLRELGYVENLESVFRCKDGSLKTALMSASVITINDQPHILSVTRDITERKRAEEALRKSEERFDLAINASNDGLFDWNLETNEIYYSPRWKSILGYEDHEIANDFSFWETATEPEDVKRSWELHQKLITGQIDRFVIEFKMKHKNGHWVDILSQAKAVFDKNGKAIRMVGTHTDISERKKLEVVLLESERKYRSLIESSSDAIFCVDEQGQYQFTNHLFASTFGKTPDYFVGKTFWDIYPKEHADFRQAVSKKVFETGESQSAEVGVPLEDKTLYFLAKANPIRDETGKVIMNLSHATDITERKLTEEALRKSEERFHYAMNASNDGLWDKNLETNEIYYSPRWKSILGYEDHEIPNDFSFWETTTDPEDVKRSREMQQKLITKQIDRFVLEYRMKHKNGHLVDVLSQAKAIFDDNGKAVRIVGTHTDITERKQIEETLRESEAKFRAMVETFPLAIHQSVGVEQITEYINPTMVKLFGYTQAEIPSVASWWPLAYPDETYRRQIAEEWTKKVKQAIATQSSIEPMEVVCTCKDGSKKNISWGYITLGDKNYSCGLDITERKLAEEKVKSLLAEKELLLKEVHHRIKNNMNTIGSLLSLQAQTLIEPSAITALNDAKARLQSMSVLYDTLYQSADYTTVPVKVYLPVLVDEIVANYPNSQIVKVEKKIEDFILDAKHLQPLGIIINELLTNSMKYAFKGRGSGLIMVSATKTKGHIVVSIQDDGVGMPKSITFENSTGFGLQLVQALAQQLNGMIRIERGNGTKVVLEFDV